MENIGVSFHRDGITSGREKLAVYTQELLALCLEEHGIPNAEITVLYCSMARIRELNREFLHTDKATDVLSFPALENPRRAPRKKSFHLGDIAICPRYCAKQAPDFKRTTGQEIALLIVHGFLHLIGHDHDTPAKEKAMWAETDRLLKKAGKLGKVVVKV